MGFIHVLADETSIYATTADGALLWYGDLFRNGQNGPTAQTGWAARSGNIISTAGWTGFRHVFAGGEGIIYVVTDDGQLHWFQDLSRFGRVEWHPNSRRQIDVGWGDFSHVFCDGTGVIYAAPMARCSGIGTTCATAPTGSVGSGVGTGQRQPDRLWLGRLPLGFLGR